MRTKTLHVTPNTAASPPVTVHTDRLGVRKHRHQIHSDPEIINRGGN